MSTFKQARTLGIAIVLGVLAGCAGQVNEQVVAPAKAEAKVKPSSSQAAAPAESKSVESEADRKKREAREAAERSAESLRKSAMAADTLFFFEFDRSDLKQDSLDDLDAHAKYLSVAETAKVRLEGHADERGTRGYNLALAERRANAVARYLVIQGVKRSQIESVSYGEERPLSLSRDENGWSRNRRVELIYQ